MLKITVQRDGTGDFTTISEAVLAVPYECEAEIKIGPGIYREKLVCEKQNITLRGAGADQTRIVWGDGGKLPHPDGRPTHTFRSYTAFFSGENLTVEDLTIENDAGPGAQVGQAVGAESVLKITVQRDGTGDFTTISEAVQAVPYECEAEIEIGPGIYREKLVCEKQNITLRGAGADQTRIVWGDGGKLPHPDGRPTHTFRSYTAFFSGENLTVEDLTIENDAGPGAQVGQAVAAYVDSARAVFRRVKLLGNQDTLFCAPLPEKEREKDGFLGPRGLAPRRASAQYYHKCEIAGDIDFIFGGADALFEQCTLRTVDNHIPHSYVTAPSGKADGLGFVFWDCDFVSDCPAGSVYLGRPWRPEGKTAVLDCRLGAHIAPEGFSPWNDRADTNLAAFAEAGSNGPGAVPRPGWVHALTASQAAELLARARCRCRP